MITSARNPRVVAATRLKKRAMRRTDRRFLVEGPQAVAEALEAAGLVERVFHAPEASGRIEPLLGAARARGVPVHAVSAEVMARLTSTVTPQGVVAVSRFVDVPLEAALGGRGCVAVLLEVRDPGNAGTILRSADASGAEAVLFSGSSVDVYNPKTVRATAGSLFHVPVVREVDPEEAVRALRARGYAVLAAGADGRTPVHDAGLGGPAAVLFGNEARGLAAEAVALADDTVRVPILGRAESLNLAAAATLVLFESARQRAGGPPGDTGHGGTEPAGASPADLAAAVAGAAHDLRSPLTALKAFAGTLRSRWDRMTDEERATMLDGLLHDAARMEVILAHLVDAARIRAGTLQLSPAPVDLLAAARRVGEEVAAWGWGEVAVTGSSAPVRSDAARLRSILVAMIEGARWWGDRGPVRVEVDPGPFPGVRVSREGSTLPGAQASEVFAPRGPGSGGGSKIGLLVGRDLARAMGGDLEAVVGEAFELRLRLPTGGDPHGLGQKAH